NLKEEWHYPWVFLKPLFHLVLAIFEFPFWSSVKVMLAAKAAMLVNALVIFWLCHRLTRTLVRSAESRHYSAFIPEYVPPWAALVLLLANTGFINQGYRVRADLISTTLFLFALERTIAHSSRTKKASILRFLPLLATPKAIFQIIPL